MLALQKSLIPFPLTPFTSPTQWTMYVKSCKYNTMKCRKNDYENCLPTMNLQILSQTINLAVKENIQ